MCGLFGFCAKKGQKANLLKLKMLGVVNTTRGTDSCGYYFSGHLAKGVDKMKDFTNFAAEQPFVRGDGPVDIFIGHTRKSTFGLHNEKNAHPHVINDNYIQTHNGTLSNDLELNRKYDISFADASIDSLTLAYIIEKHGFKVLEEYEGYAALVMAWKKRPESIFLFHGAHKDWYDDKYMWIERPMYTLEQPEGLYYSSMINSLQLINETGEEVLELPCNGVYEVRNGILIDEPYKIDRKFTGTKHRGTQYNNTKKEDRKNTSITILPKKTEPVELNNDDAIFTEYVSSTKNDLYFQHGRYYGADGKLLQGEYTIDRDCNIIPSTTSKKELEKYRVPEKYYFLYGVMIDNEGSYYKLKNRTYYGSDNVAKQLSLHSVYPVICLESEFHLRKDDPEKYLWFKNGTMAKMTCEFTPKFTNSSYKIRNGKTVNIIKIEMKNKAHGASVGNK